MALSKISVKPELWVSILLIILLVAACEPMPDQDNKSVFRYNEAAGVSSLDPAYARDLANIWACNQIYSGLVRLDKNLQIRPAIASDWEVSEDGKIYTFHLRPDVLFHDHPLFKNGAGRKVNAGDFVYSFNRVLNPAAASPGAWVFNHVKNDETGTGFTALNDSTFEIRLVKAFPPFLGILGMQYCSVVPHELVEHYGRDFRQNPIGTGPFRFKYWKEGVKLVMIKNKHFYQVDETGLRLPYLDAVAISFLKDKQSAFLEFIKGNLDFMSGIDPNYKDELLSPDGNLNPKYNDRIYLKREPYLNTEYLGFLVDTNMPEVRQSPLSLQKIRQAINFGFSRKDMIRYLRNGIGTPGNYGIIPPGLPSFHDDDDVIYTYDPQKARQLLKEAGFPNASELPEITLLTTSEYLDLCKYIQHQLSLLGINLKINVNTPGALRELKAQSKAAFFRGSWIADYPDAENYLSLFYSGNFAPNGPNYTHYASKQFDQYYQESQSIVNSEARYALYRKMDSLVMADAPVVILYYDEVLRFIRKDVSGLGINPVNLLDLTGVRKNSQQVNISR